MRVTSLGIALGLATQITACGTSDSSQETPISPTNALTASAADSFAPSGALSSNTLPAATPSGMSSSLPPTHTASASALAPSATLPSASSAVAPGIPSATATASSDAPTTSATSSAPEPSTSEACVPDYACQPEAPDTGDFYADCVARVNQFRACVCLPPLERRADAEDCLNQQAEYDSTRDPHSGFIDSICEPGGNAQNECPGWGSATQVVRGCVQQMFDEGPPEQQPCEGDCYQAHGHYINMTSTRYTKVACGIFESADGIWSVQNFY